MLGVVQNQDSYAQGVAAQRPFYFDHVAALTDRAFDGVRRADGAPLRARARLPARRRGVRDRRPGLASSRTPRRSPTICATKRRLRVGVLEPHDVPPVPGGSRDACCSRQARRRRARARRSAAGRGCAAAARDPRGDEQGAREWPRRERRAALPHPGVERGARAARDAGLLLRLLRPREPRPPAGRHHRRGGEHAAVRARSDGSSTSASTSSARDTQLPKLQIWQEQLRESLSAARANCRCRAPAT